MRNRRRARRTVPSTAQNMGSTACPTLRLAEEQNAAAHPQRPIRIETQERLIGLTAFRIIDNALVPPVLSGPEAAQDLQPDKRLIAACGIGIVDVGLRIMRLMDQRLGYAPAQPAAAMFDCDHRAAVRDDP